MADAASLPGTTHGALILPTVVVGSYNVELRDRNGFIGDRANQEAFRDLLEKWRRVLRKTDNDPFGRRDSVDIAKKKLAAALFKGDVEAAGIVQSAMEEF